MCVPLWCHFKKTFTLLLNYPMRIEFFSGSLWFLDIANVFLPLCCFLCINETQCDGGFIKCPFYTGPWKQTDGCWAAIGVFTKGRMKNEHNSSSENKTPDEHKPFEKHILRAIWKFHIGKGEVPTVCMARILGEMETLGFLGLRLDSSQQSSD